MITKVDVGIAQYLIRQAFEEGYRAANPERGVSGIDPTKGRWFDHWLISQTRNTLLVNGVITGQEEYK